MEEKLNKSEVQFSQTNFWRDFLGVQKNGFSYSN